MQRQSTVLWLLLVGGALMMLVGFWPVLGNGFVNWDDPYNFINNYFFRGLNQEHLVWALSTRHLGVYQPIAWLMLELEYVMFGLKAEAFHLVSLVIHGTNTLLLGLFALRVQTLFRARELTPVEVSYIGAGTLFFALHPLRVEAVAWASCQPYLVCLFFLLASLVCFMESKRCQKHQGQHNAASISRKWSVGSHAAWSGGTLVFYVAACLSKATAVFFPVLLITVDYLWHKSQSQTFKVPEVLLRRTPYFLVSMLTAGFAIWARSEIHQSPYVLRLPLINRLAMSSYAMGVYLSKTCLPVNISHYYPPPDLLQPSNMVVALLPLVCLMVVVRKRKSAPALMLAFGVFTAALAANLGIFQIGSTVASDRYTYVATAAAICVLACGTQVSAQRRFRTILILPILLALTWAARSQSQIWRDSITLWRHALAKGGDVAEDVHNNLGLALDESGNAAEAETAYKRAVAINPAYGLAHTNLGILYVKQAKFDDASRHFATAIELDPEANEALNGLAYIKFLQNDLADAAKLNDIALSLRPSDLSNLELKAQLESRRGHFDLALETAKRGLAFEPNHASLLNTLGAIQMMVGQFDQAKISFERAIAVRPEFVEPIVNLADILVMMGDPGGAQDKYRTALKIDPNHAKARRAIGGNP
ncbi:MAG: tetratricopeptide repeat protein [Deltaproteobacteria bacterium]|nr:tetratricopeptide repeat protein [Deltaproteobacteria bacterium]